jgi:hypothetical protein
MGQANPGVAAEQNKPQVHDDKHDQGPASNAKPVPEKLSVSGKFKYFAGETFRPGSLVVAGLYSAFDMASPPKSYPREWRQGIGGFGRNYGDFMASWAAVQGGKFLVASAIHEDPRYMRSSSTNVLARSYHALQFVFIDKSDSGRNRVAIPNFAGAFAGGFVGNSYLPDGYRNLSHAAARSAVALGGFATSNLADEFQPELKALAKKLHLPFVGD